MPQERGFVTREQLEAYSIADVMLLNNENNITYSGGEATGEDTYTWVVRWDENGFTGIRWNVGEWDLDYNFSGMYPIQGDAYVSSIVNDGSNGINLAMAMSSSPSLIKAGCGGYQEA